MKTVFQMSIVNKYWKQAHKIKERGARESYKKLKHSMVPAVAKSGARDLISRRKSFAPILANAGIYIDRDRKFVMPPIDEGESESELDEEYTVLPSITVTNENLGKKNLNEEWTNRKMFCNTDRLNSAKRSRELRNDVWNSKQRMDMTPLETCKNFASPTTTMRYNNELIPPFYEHSNVCHSIEELTEGLSGTSPVFFLSDIPDGGYSCDTGYKQTEVNCGSATGQSAVGDVGELQRNASSCSIVISGQESQNPDASPISSLANVGKDVNSREGKEMVDTNEKDLNTMSYTSHSTITKPLVQQDGTRYDVTNNCDKNNYYEADLAGVHRGQTGIQRVSGLYGTTSENPKPPSGLKQSKGLLHVTI